MRRIGQYPLLIFIGLIILGTFSRLGPLGESFFNLEFDYANLFSPFKEEVDHSIRNQLAVIYLDQDSHQALNQPDSQRWDRSLHAQLINKLTDAGVGLIYFDILFQQDGDDPAADQALEDAIKRNGSVILIGQFSKSDTARGSSRNVISPHVRFRTEPRNWGLAAFREDGDGAIRRMPVELDDPHSGPWIAANRVSPNKLDESLRSNSTYIRFHSDYPAPIENTWSYHQVLSDSFNHHQLKDKWVFIGARQELGYTGSSKDTFRTPFSRLFGAKWNGVDFHIVAFENYLHGGTIKPISVFIEILWIVVASLILVGVILIPSNRPRIIYLVLLGILLPGFALFWAGSNASTTPYLTILLILLPSIGFIVAIDRPFSFDLFISYSHADNERLNYLSDLTQVMYEEGLRCWSDSYIEIGEKWRESILTAVEKSRGLLVIVSKDTSASVEILTEIRFAQHHALKIFPVFLDVPKSDKLTLELGELHRHDLDSNQLSPKELRKLARTIRKKIYVPLYRRWINKLFYKHTANPVIPKQPSSDLEQQT